MTGFRDTAAAVEKLVTRIVAGEAVFLVGAGFSLESEPNTSSRLIRRLLTRFAAITDHLSAAPQSEAPRLREGLRITFKLSDEPLSSAAMVRPSTVDQLTPVYYSINDWMVSAFTILIAELNALEPASQPVALGAIQARETEILGLASGVPYDDVPLDGFDVRSLARLGSESGKALFLDTLGFANPSVWHGDPRAGTERALESFGSRLRDRHVAIARLAREGVAPLILTTNFDLLLEGACRAIGFEVGDVRETDPVKPPAAYDRVLVVAGPTDFFDRGTGYRAALLLKIHGCVQRYRDERAGGRLSTYLPSMVFTYREIQNWRKDSWSRDLVSTLLRTRAIILCGYSGADAVIHDTFRTVYEEILAHRSHSPAGNTPPEKDTLAFFTGAAGRAEFPGLEILRASSRAAGVAEPKLFDHPNYLGIHFPTAGRRQSFPNLDELFVWIYHRSLRCLQLNAIRSDLQRIAVTLLRRNVSPTDVGEIAASFEAQCARERDEALAWLDADESRRQFQELTAWTNHFHVGLLRECALMESVARNQRSGLRIQEFRAPSYYFSLLDRPGWGAWAAVVELALRRMGARDAAVAPSAFPMVIVRRLQHEYTPTAIVLRGPALTRSVRRDALGVYRHVHTWQLMSWLRPDVPAPGTPSAEDIWTWALGPGGDAASAPPAAWFGEPNEQSARRPGLDGRASVRSIRDPVVPAG